MKSRFSPRAKIKALLAKKRKKRKGRNGDAYGPIPISSIGGGENPVGGN